MSYDLEDDVEVDIDNILRIQESEETFKEFKNEGKLVYTRKLGKYAGDCCKCGLMRGTIGDDICGRCGHVHENPAVPVPIG